MSCTLRIVCGSVQAYPLSVVFQVTAERKVAMRETVWAKVGGPAAVEMENAGVAQVYRAFNIPYVSLRSAVVTSQ